MSATDSEVSTEDIVVGPVTENFTSDMMSPVCTEVTLPVILCLAPYYTGISFQVVIPSI